MTPEQTRSLIAQLAIAATLCGGLYALVADPMRCRVRDAEADLSAFVSRHDDAAAMLADLPAVVATHDQTVRRAVEYQARSVPAHDEAVLFSKILDLATEAEIAVEHIIPSGEEKTVGGSTASPAPRPGDRTMRCAVSGAGSYAATAEFMKLLQSGWGYCTIRECRITPDYNGETSGGVQFSLVIELFGFDASPIALGAETEGDTP